MPVMLQRYIAYLNDQVTLRWEIIIAFMYEYHNNSEVLL